MICHGGTRFPVGNLQVKQRLALGTSKENRMITTTVWGSRGSIPVSGSQFHRYGGATTCLELTLQDAQGLTPSRILIDCGTGLTELGKEWGDRENQILLLQTHMHWDHIQGFPFFRPLFQPDAELTLWSTPREGCTFQEQLSQQMCRPAFPVGLDILPAQLNFVDLPESGEQQLGELTITWADVDHPSGNTAYRLDYRGFRVVFSGDVELPHSPSSRENLLALAENADLLILDAQYLPSEYPTRKGFGHSTPEDAVALALDAGVKQMLMTHHDPSHTDAQLDSKQALAQQLATGTDLCVRNAYDRLTVNLSETNAHKACA
ncbi:MAG: MBL fold metallo-hydrolase [Deltaproteobacteria bacterium]|nr:MAG: MBL fold metallo-hydrolase [Deltaproteobacteria bacterium]